MSGDNKSWFSGDLIQPTVTEVTLFGGEGRAGVDILIGSNQGPRAPDGARSESTSWPHWNHKLI